MAASLNEVTLIGHLGRDPEIRTTQGGDKVANFSLATSEKWADKRSGERRELTEWHRVVVWGPVAGIVERYVKKGDSLLVRGSLRTRKWQDQSGTDRYTTEIVCSGPRAFVGLNGQPGSARGGDGEAGNWGPGGPSDKSPEGAAGGGGGGGGGGGDLDDEIPF
jgi:single-strand DNA-binding protein